MLYNRYNLGNIKKQTFPYRGVKSAKIGKTGKKFSFLENLERELNNLTAKSYPVKVCGVFNIHVPRNNLTAKFLVIVETCGFDQLIRELIRFGTQSETLLDHIFFT